MKILAFLVLMSGTGWTTAATSSAATSPTNTPPPDCVSSDLITARMHFHAMCGLSAKYYVVELMSGSNIGPLIASSEAKACDGSTAELANDGTVTLQFEQNAADVKVRVRRIEGSPEYLHSGTMGDGTVGMAGTIPGWISVQNGGTLEGMCFCPGQAEADC